MSGKLILDQTFGKRLKSYRLQKGFTQADVVRRAHLLGSMMPESTYAKIEQGTRNIFISDLVILKIILGFRYEDLFADIEKAVLDAAK